MGTHPIFESDFDCLTDIVGWGWSIIIFNMGKGVRSQIIIKYWELIQNQAKVILKKHIEKKQKNLIPTNIQMIKKRRKNLLKLKKLTIFLLIIQNGSSMIISERKENGMQSDGLHTMLTMINGLHQKTQNQQSERQRLLREWESD